MQHKVMMSFNYGWACQVWVMHTLAMPRLLQSLIERACYDCKKKPLVTLDHRHYELKSYFYSCKGKMHVFMVEECVVSVLEDTNRKEEC